MKKTYSALLGLLLIVLPLAEAFAQATTSVNTARRGTNLPSNILDVRADYGALCNNEADDLAAITAAVERAVVLRGATILIPAICRVSSTIQVNGSNISFLGHGPTISQIRITSAAVPALVFGNGTTDYNFNFVDGVGITSTVSRTAGGTGVRFNRIGVGGYYRGYIANQHRGIEIIGGSGLIKVGDSRIVDPTSGTGAGIYIDAAVEPQLFNLTIACVTAAQPFAAVHMAAANGFRLENVDSVGCGSGLAMAPGPGQIIEHGFLARNSFDGGSGSGILMNAVRGATIRAITATGDWATSNGDNGVVTTGAGTIQGIEINGLRAMNNINHGAIFSSGTDIRISGGLYAGNSLGSSGARDGILFDGISGFSVIGARSGQAAGNPGKQRYGIAVTSVGSDNYVLADNDVRSNATAGILLASAIGATRLVTGNLGHVTANKAISTGLRTDSSGDVTISHGLAGTPVQVWAQLKGTTAAHILNPHTYGATTFKIRVYDAAGAAVATTAIDPVAWRAEQ